MDVMKHFSVPVFPWGKRPPGLEDVLSLTRHLEELGFYSANTPLINTLDARSGGAFAHFNNKYTLDALTLLPAMVAATEHLRIAVDGVRIVAARGGSRLVWKDLASATTFSVED